MRNAPLLERPALLQTFMRRQLVGRPVDQFVAPSASGSIPESSHRSRPQGYERDSDSNTPLHSLLAFVQ